MESGPRHATVDRGHITKPERLENTYTSDTSLQRALSWYLPAQKLEQAQPQLVELGEEAISDQIREWSADAERHQPYVKGFNVWGQRYDYDRLITSEGWKQLGKWGARHGVVSLGYEPTYGAERRLVQYAVNYLYSPSSGLYSCPVSMSDGAALVLNQERKNVAADHPFQTAYQKLISKKEDYWTSGQWMTERAGGSDVQNTETWATYSPLSHRSKASNGLDEGDYLINGFKFFSSATDANIALMLAKTPSGKLSTFLAPLRKTIVGEDGKPRVVTNGVRIHRLKNKLGTKELPTAELELKDMRAHLVGTVDHGVMAIAPLLNITRTHTFIGSLAAWRRAISITKSFGKVRTTVGEPLWLIPMHLSLLADLEVKHRGAMNLAFFTVAVMGVVENNGVSTPAAHLPTKGKEAQVVFRALTAIAKAVISKNAIAGIQECQEGMGGVGYMDEPDEPEFNIARLLRNTAVNSIWEGTTNVLASELVRFLVKRDNLTIFSAWFERTLALITTPEFASALKQIWSDFLSRIKATSEPRFILADARRVMFTLAWILCGALLALDAERDGDGVTTEIARRWILSGEGGVGDMVWRDIISVQRTASAGPSSITNEHLRWDCRIAWGVELPAKQVSGHRSFQGTGSKL
ncbi:acyl-CoA dehydrogenase [Aspergillus flavus]|uniref:Acyl-CoA dehydrogenase n=1 Tax=Aspergillus flavus TaxID=5059 RepID=A0AB74BUR5_ASPFL|nr:acyl-CoA dehydrogenase [Aspergillus flavus]